MSIEKADQTDSNTKANFETAISATKFGKFNIILMVCTIPAAMTPIVDNTTTSYIIPAAKCDLELTLQQKGTLTSAIFIGYILSSYLWGFLGDTFGRRRVLFIIFLFDLLINITGAFMQTFFLQYLYKFFAGFFASGSYALIFTYASEFFSTQYRSIAVLMIGLSMAFIILIIPMIAWVVMPLPDVYVSSYVFHSWQQFILITSIPCFLSTILFTFLPETPKYLMTTGKNEEAMKLFQQIYHWNTGNDVAEYPIKELQIETVTTTNQKTITVLDFFKLLRNGLIQMKELFQPPLLLNIIKCIVAHFGMLLGTNTTRLWLPQFFTSIDEYNQMNGLKNGTLCEVLEYFYSNNNNTVDNVTEEFDAECVAILPNDEVYINSIIASVGCCVGYIILMMLIKRCKIIHLLVFMVTVGGCSTLGMYWSSNNRSGLLIFSAISIGLDLISSTTLMSLVVELFPTTLRGVAVSFTLMSGQLGSFMGNALFPVLLQSGCFPPFLFIGCIVIFCGLLCFTLPNPSGKDFK